MLACSRFLKYLFICFFTTSIFLVQTVRADEEGLPLHGFVDAGGGSTSSNAPIGQRSKGFSIGTVDFYLAPEFQDGVKSLMEIAFEPSLANGGIGVDVERLQIGYTVNDYLTLWAGRFHTPYGYWNTAYHHGAQLQTSIFRPRFIDFEDKGGVLPAHSVGLWANGHAKIGDNKLVYNFYIANGSRITGDGALPGTLDPNLVRSDKDKNLIGGSIAWSFGNLLEGLQIGLHGLGGQVNSYTSNNYLTAANHSTDVNMYGGFIVYENNGVEFDGEIYLMSDKDLLTSGAEKENSSLGFAQVGYSVSNKWKPYLRYEKTSLNSKDTYFSDQSNGLSYSRYAGGVRYDVNPRAALKFEWLQTTLEDNIQNPNYNTYQVQYAIRF